MNAFIAPFQISEPSIIGLLSQHTMKIPDLQRPFAWGETQARELCADLEKLLESLWAGNTNPQHFFGTLVVIEQAAQSDDIVDGQQRMTTVTLLLGLVHGSYLRLIQNCKNLAAENSNNQVLVDHYDSIAALATHSANFLKNLLFVSDGFTPDNKIIWKPRVEVSPEITKTYREFLDGEDGDVSSEMLQPAKDLRKVASIFENRLVEPQGYEKFGPRTKYDYLQNLMDVIGKGLIVVRLGTVNADSAYELFESLNARGLQLNVLDHLKVWMLSVFSQAKTDSSTVASQMRTLANDDRTEQVRFFEDYYQARSQDNQKYDGIDAPKKLVSAARRIVFRDPSENGKPDIMTLPKRIESEVDYMTKLFPIWQKLKQSHEPNPYVPTFFSGSVDEVWMRNRLELLLGSVLKHQKGYPYLMVAAERLRNKPAEYADLVHLIEKFFFRYRSVCGGSEKNIAELYNQLLIQIDSFPGFNINVVKTKMRALIAADAPDNVFRDKLILKLGYGGAPRTKYFFEMLDAHSYGPLLKRPGRLKITEWHLEHIVPQNPKQGDPDLDKLEIDTIGNLCLLPPWINTQLSNLNYADKQTKAISLRNNQNKIGLADAESIFYTGSGPIWSSTDVAKRAADLQDSACRVFAI